MQPLSTRTEHFTDSVIRRMTRVSAKYGAINLSQGYPDFNPPSAISTSIPSPGARRTSAKHWPKSSPA